MSNYVGQDCATARERVLENARITDNDSIFYQDPGGQIYITVESGGARLYGFSEVAICHLAVLGIWIFRYFNND
jgi:hypothetical protein